ncbi:hypothetical protein H5410_001480, partial [Solanum commersonii]
YRGTKFLNWLGDHLFLKLVKLSLSNCKDCYSLPALEELPCLKFLSIRGMHGITKVMEELYGSLSSKKPFNYLEKLEFEDMPKWKQWRFPENIPSLTELGILETPLFYEAQLFRYQLQGMKQIVELYISDCDSLTSLPFSILPSSLKRIEISECQKLKFTTTSYQQLQEIELVIDHDGTEEEVVAGGNWEFPSSIQRLLIYNLKTLSSRHLKSLASLQYLYTYELPQT